MHSCMLKPTPSHRSIDRSHRPALYSCCCKAVVKDAVGSQQMSRSASVAQATAHLHSASMMSSCVTKSPHPAMLSASSCGAFRISASSLQFASECATSSIKSAAARRNNSSELVLHLATGPSVQYH